MGYRRKHSERTAPQGQDVGRTRSPWCLWTTGLVEAVRRMDTLSIVASRRLGASGNAIPHCDVSSWSSAWTTFTMCTWQVARGSRSRNCSLGDMRHGLITGRSLTWITPLSAKRTLSECIKTCGSRDLVMDLVARGTLSCIYLLAEPCHRGIPWLHGERRLALVWRFRSWPQCDPARLAYVACLEVVSDSSPAQSILR